ncbi:unnamed protein product [Dibothriocephalus latus]|uniref:PPM-type phosphatase domain-containing protein n=1 Tax=Dibothriocephalus latus TaxID=60516 RepID=A0A3P6USI3_DIBLA|nr:unnamed protein product [Dibothriocephalus latus]
MDFFVLEKFLREVRESIFPQAAHSTKDSVRLRTKQVMSKVKKTYASAYMLSHATRLLYMGEADAFCPQTLDKKGSGYCQFDSVQRYGAECLKKAIDASVEWLASGNLEHFPKPGLTASCIKKISIASLLNRRRRQEDRWFLVADLLKYAPTQEKLTYGEYPMILGCGVFDGHGGPEAAEHCSNLAPLLLSRRLQRRFLPSNKDCKSQETIPDILASVIDDLNFSVSECHREKVSPSYSLRYNS